MKINKLIFNQLLFRLVVWFVFLVIICNIQFVYPSYLMAQTTSSVSISAGGQKSVTIPFGGSVSLSWNIGSNDSERCSTPTNQGGNGNSGSTVVGPLYRNTNYSVSCQKLDGRVESDSMVVIVSPDNSQPSINLWVNDRKNEKGVTINKGERVVIHWLVNASGSGWQCVSNINDTNTDKSLNNMSGEFVVESFSGTKNYTIKCQKMDMPLTECPGCLITEVLQISSKIDSTSCITVNKTLKVDQECCSGLIEKNGKCIKKEEDKCIVENKTVKSGQFCCEGLEEKDGKCVTSETASKMKVKILGGAYDASKTTKSISKNIVSMNLECDGNTTELTKTSGSKKLTEYGNFTFNVNMSTSAKCTLNNTSENNDYKFKGYTICQNKDIPNCHKNQKINSSNSIDLTEYDLKNNDKLQVRWYYDKGETTSNGVTSDDNDDNSASDNVSTSRINRLIELLEKLLEKLGVK